MKRSILVCLCLALCLGLLTSCADQTGSSGAPANTPAVSAADTPSAAPSDGDTPAPSPLPSDSVSEDPIPDQLQFHTEIYEEEDAAVVEYIAVTGLPDEAVQDNLNENIKDFFLWQWLYRSPDADPDENYYYGTATCHVVGGRFLSVVRFLDVYSQEHPITGDSDTTPKRIIAQTFDLTTGEPAGDLVFGGTAYTMAGALDKFSQVYPDADDQDAKNKFHDLMQSRDVVYNYFLTDYLLAIYFENDSGDDFYRFDAPYDQIPEMLAQPLMDAIKAGN